MLLDSLVSKNMVASWRLTVVKNGFTRVLATALAMLMLFSTIAGPISIKRKSPQELSVVF